MDIFILKIFQNLNDYSVIKIAFFFLHVWTHRDFDFWQIFISRRYYSELILYVLKIQKHTEATFNCKELWLTFM